MARTKKTSLRVIPLGGLEEIGKNMTVIEYGNDMVVIDAGLMFPDEDSPGVDLVLPDYSYILKRKDKLRGIVITHGHEDHIGALPYLLEDVGHHIPVFGTRLTLGMITPKLEEARIKKPKLREVHPGTPVNLGVFGFDFIPVNHSIPDAVAVLIRTPVGNILHTGDFKIDQTPIDGRTTDFSALAAAGDEGVLLLMSDSTNAENTGFTRSEAEVGKTLRVLFDAAEQRVIVASFASHIHRLQQVCDAAIGAGRKIVVTGRSMLNVFKVARELGFLKIDEKNVIDAYDMGDIPARKVVVLSTGSQGEPLSALARMANGDHRTVKVEAGDTVVISATPVPGNEKAVSRVINRLAKAGADIYHKGIADVHVSGHAAAEELKLMLRLTRPRFLMPIHGETRHLHAHARIGESVGMAHEAVFVLENGDCLELNASGARLGQRVESGVVFVDGLSVGEVGSVVLRDRQHMSSDGIATVVIALDRRSGQLIGEPELVLRGVAFPEADGIGDELRARLAKTLARTGGEGVTDQGVIKKAVRDSLTQFLWERVRRRPLIIPIVVEV
jgi:ribonuclease J